MGKMLFRTCGCLGFVPSSLKCLPAKFRARPETAGDWASGHLILQPEAKVVPTVSKARGGFTWEVKRKEGVLHACCVLWTPSHTMQW